MLSLKGGDTASHQLRSDGVEAILFDGDQFEAEEGTGDMVHGAQAAGGVRSVPINPWQQGDDIATETHRLAFYCNSRTVDTDGGEAFTQFVGNDILQARIRRQP
jgi:hypothetical protein